MDPQITIEAFNINSGGAKNLLLYLIKYLHNKVDIKLSNRDTNIIFLIKELKHVDILPSSFLSVFIRYVKPHANTLYFGNLPPVRKSENSLLYIHNRYLALTIKEIFQEKIPNFSKFKLLLQHFFILTFHHNTTNVAVQTSSMAVCLKNILKREILILPFFENLTENRIEQKRFDFCYVGLPSKHKNHENLLLAIENLVKDDKNFSIAMTIPLTPDNVLLLKNIETINRLKKNTIKNFGLVDQASVNEIYSLSKALIFPSKKETLGLPIIEALQHNIKVLSSDREFSYELIDNPITFNPENVKEIQNCMKKFLENQYFSVVQRLNIKSEIDQIINLVL